eukprot:11155522-Lingulodinium_polyedra.AAC.1
MPSLIGLFGLIGLIDGPVSTKLPGCQAPGTQWNQCTRGPQSRGHPAQSVRPFSHSTPSSPIQPDPIQSRRS